MLTFSHTKKSPGDERDHEQKHIDKEITKTQELFQGLSRVRNTNLQYQRNMILIGLQIQFDEQYVNRNKVLGL